MGVILCVEIFLIVNTVKITKTSCILSHLNLQLNLVDSKSSGPRQILRNTEASKLTNYEHPCLPTENMLSCKKYVKR